MRIVTLATSRSLHGDEEVRRRREEEARPQRTCAFHVGRRERITVISVLYSINISVYKYLPISVAVAGLPGEHDGTLEHHILVYSSS